MQCLLNPDDSKTINKWRNFLEEQPDNNIFQSYEIYDLFSNYSLFKSNVIVCIKNGDILGSLIFFNIKEKNKFKSFFSRRSLIYYKPIIKENNSDVYNKLISFYLQVNKHHVIYTETRNSFINVKVYREALLSNSFKERAHYNITVKTVSQEIVNSRFSKSKKRQIKNAINSGVEITEPNSEKDIIEFYRILKYLYKTKVKKPLPDYSFFKLLYTKGNESFKFFLIRYKEKLIGGILCPISNDIIHEWYIAGLDSTYKKQYPSIMATYAPIKYALENRMSYFDFMGAGSPNEYYGVREFKLKFGGDLIQTERMIKVHNKLLYTIGKFVIKSFKLLNGIFY